MDDRVAFTVFVTVFCGSLGLVTLLMLAAAIGLLRETRKAGSRIRRSHSSMSDV